MTDSPLDRVRRAEKVAVQAGDSSYSITAIDMHGIRLILPYANLKGAIVTDGKCILMHEIARVVVTAPANVLEEIGRLLSLQRLVALRHESGTTVIFDFEEKHSRLQSPH